MTEEDWIRSWQQAYADTYVSDGAENRKLPSKQHLDALEAVLHLSLPLSYRSFVQVFGPGRVAQSFVVFAPGYAHAPRVDFPNAERWQSLVELSPDRLAVGRDYVAFADFRGHDGIFVWHRGMPTDSANREYMIYFVPRISTEAPIQIARSFADLIMDDFFKSSFFPKYGVSLSEVELEWDDEETGERRTRRCFEPIGGDVSPVSAT